MMAGKQLAWYGQAHNKLDLFTPFAQFLLGKQTVPLDNPPRTFRPYPDRSRLELKVGLGEGQGRVRVRVMV